MPRIARPRRAQIEQSLQHRCIDFWRIAVLQGPGVPMLIAIPNGEARDPVTAAKLVGISAEQRAYLPEHERLSPFGLGVVPGVMAGAPPAQQAAPAPEPAPPAWLGTCYGCFWWGLHLASDKTQIILPRINTVRDCNRPVPGLLWGAKPAGESTPATASCSKHLPLTPDQVAVAIPATKP